MTAHRRPGCLRSNLSGTKVVGRALSSNAHVFSPYQPGEIMNIRSVLAVVFGLTLSIAIVAQTSEANKQAPKTVAANSKVAKDPEAERLMKERRDNAQSLLLNLASEAGRFNDQILRARTQARIADVLWPADSERARALFRKAWDSAEIVDREGQRKVEEDIKQQKARNGGGSVTVTGPPDIRAEVLRLAARRDRALGEEFLARMRTEQAQDATDKVDGARNNFAAPEALAQRLNLARQLLDTDVARALQFADPALMNISREGLDFLSYLRDKDAAAADLRYSAFLAKAAADLQSDANTVSFLSSYIFTPHLFVTFSNSGGTSSSSTSRENAAPNMPAQLRNAFLRAAGDILLRPLAPPEQDQSSGGIQGKYLMLKRLQPLFDQFAPSELAEAIRAQADALAQAVPEDARQRDDDGLREGIRPPQALDDREKILRDRIDRAKTAEQRDALYIQLARLYVEKGDIGAREFVGKIEDSDLRKQAATFIDASLVIRAIDKKDTDMILVLVKDGELSHFHKSWALLQAAKLLAKTDRDKSLATIEEATAEARRIEELDPDRPRAMMGIANALLPLDRNRSWDAVSDAIKAANSAEGFTGEDGYIRITMQTKQMSSARSSSVSDFNVAGIFSELAKEDYNKTVEVIRGFQHEAPRASATIAIAKTVLEEKKN
jgi:hypothetical protein